MRIRVGGVEVGSLAGDWTIDLPSAAGVKVIRRGREMTLERAMDEFHVEATTSRDVHKTRLDGSPGTNQGAQEGERK